MKKIIATICIGILMTVTSINGQEEVVISDYSLTGGFGALYYQPGTINDQLRTWIGIGGGIILEDYFFGIYATSTFDEVPWQASVMHDNLSIAHGGFWVGYTLRSQDILHLYTSVRLGSGKAIFHQPESSAEATDIDDIITVIQPEIGAELNITKFLRLGVSMSYPFYGSIAQIPEESYEGISALRPFITIRIGRFQ